MAKRKHTCLPVVIILELVISTLELMLKDEANALPPIQAQRLQATLNLLNGRL